MLVMVDILGDTLVLIGFVLIVVAVLVTAIGAP